MKTVHLYNEYLSSNLETNRRIDFASKTWRFMYNHGVISCPVNISDLKRSSNNIGDIRNLPFIKDLINFSIEKYNPDLIILTNNDICVSENIVYELDKYLLTRDAVCAKRRNFNGPFKNIISDCEISKGIEEPWGRDLFAFKIDWWNKVKNIYPDMLLGCEQWDMIFTNLILITNPNPEVSNVIYHENHSQFWMENRYINPGQLHNFKIAAGLYEKLQILAFIRKISWNEKIDYNGGIQYEVDNLEIQGKDLLSFLKNEQ